MADRNVLGWVIERRVVVDPPLLLAAITRPFIILLSFIKKEKTLEEEENFRYVKINFRDQRQFRVKEEPRILQIDHTMKVKCVLKYWKSACIRLSRSGIKPPITQPRSPKMKTIKHIHGRCCVFPPFSVYKSVTLSSWMAVFDAKCLLWPQGGVRAV